MPDTCTILDARNVVEAGPNITYPSMSSAERVRQIMRGLLKLVDNDQEAELKRLRAAVSRLGSMEAFSGARAIIPASDVELIARIKYAREVIATELYAARHMAEAEALIKYGRQAVRKQLIREWGLWRWENVFDDTRRQLEVQRVLGLQAND